MLNFWINLLAILGILANCRILFALGNHKVSYGQSCTSRYSSLRYTCDSAASLTCQNGICACAKPDTTVYDEVKQKCVLKVGETCKTLIEGTTLISPSWYSAFSSIQRHRHHSDYYNYNWQNGRKIGTTTTTTRKPQYKSETCVTHGTCNSGGICACEKSYLESTIGTCIPLRLIHESCHRSDQCRVDLFLSCLNEICKCDPAVSMTSRVPLQGQFCLGLARKPCLNKKCVPNASCCGGKCVCDEFYVTSQNGDGLCHKLKFYDETCSPGVQNCHSDFVCLNGKCKCKYSEENHFYDNSLHICRSFVGGPCSLNGTSEQCCDNAKCVLNPRTGFPECQCKAPFLENSKGLCKELEFGADCKEIDTCDSIPPLVCRNGKCDCGDDLKIHDSEARRCRRVVGSICYHNKQCVRNAGCSKPDEKSEKSGANRGHCECNEDFEVDKVNRTCNEVWKPIGVIDTNAEMYF